MKKRAQNSLTKFSFHNTMNRQVEISEKIFPVKLSFEANSTTNYENIHIILHSRSGADKCLGTSQEKKSQPFIFLHIHVSVVMV